MLTIQASGTESLWDEILPAEVKALPQDLARLDDLLADPGLLGADRGAVGAAAGRDRLLLRAGASDDRDGNVRAVDDRQAPLRLGVRDVDAGGVGLDPSAPFLPDRDERPGAGRVDGAQADPPAGRGGGARDHARADLQGPAGEAVPAAGGADRLDRCRGRRALSDRRGAGGRWRAGACQGGAQAGGQDRREAHCGQGSLAGDGSQAACVDALDPPPLGGGEGRGAGADRADREAARAVDPRGAQARRDRPPSRARPRRSCEAPGRAASCRSSPIAARR